MPEYQLIIIGGGPAGLTAATYAGRSGLKTLLISTQLGGGLNLAHKVQNFPGQIEIAGPELAEKMLAQAKKWSAEIITAEVVDLKKNDDYFVIQTKENKIYKSQKLLLALGTQKRKLNLPNEEKYIGRGISYCALCDGHFFKNKNVAVCGSGDAATTTAIYLSDLAKKVYLIARGENLKCNPDWQKTVQSKKNIDIICGYGIKELIGQENLTNLRLQNIQGSVQELSISGLFVEIGSMPSSLLAQKIDLELDSEGFIKIDQSGKTSQLNVWAAGDITSGSNKLWQAITAAAEGAIAADSIYKSFKGN